MESSPKRRNSADSATALACGSSSTINNDGEPRGSARAAQSFAVIFATSGGEGTCLSGFGEDRYLPTTELTSAVEVDQVGADFPEPGG